MIMEVKDGLYEPTGPEDMMTVWWYYSFGYESCLDASFAGFRRAVFLPWLRDGLDDDRGLRGHRPGAWSHRPAGEALAGGGEGDITSKDVFLRCVRIV